MKLIRNPLKELVFVVVEGVKYQVEAKGSIEVEDKVAVYWKNQHHFLQVGEVGAPEVEVKLEEPKKEEVKKVEVVKNPNRPWPGAVKSNKKGKK